ncbi:MAG: NAD(P)-binding domain-containing protein, partial [Bacteroidetes bacterium]|nr:NAD(P)-binding domain-containing protein [Bacteroidota bacterium]
MKLGMIGLGKMGGNMARRLLLHNHEVVGFSPVQSEVESAVEAGASGASSLEEL